MHKKYVVRLTVSERRVLREVVRKLSGSSAKVRRAQILLKADAAGPNWTDPRIAEAFDCRGQTVENGRQRLRFPGLYCALGPAAPGNPPPAPGPQGGPARPREVLRA